MQVIEPQQPVGYISSQVIKGQSDCAAHLQQAIERHAHARCGGLPFVLLAMLHERASEGVDPFSHRDGFHTHGVVQRRFEFEFAGEHVKASLTYERGGSLTLSVGSGEAMVTSPLVFEQRTSGIELQFAGQRTRAAQQRFINLIDVLYDQDKYLVLIGEQPLDAALQGTANDLART